MAEKRIISNSDIGETLWWLQSAVTVLSVLSVFVAMLIITADFGVFAKGTLGFIARMLASFFVAGIVGRVLWLASGWVLRPLIERWRVKHNASI